MWIEDEPFITEIAVIDKEKKELVRSTEGVVLSIQYLVSFITISLTSLFHD